MNTKTGAASGKPKNRKKGAVTGTKGGARKQGKRKPDGAPGASDEVVYAAAKIFLERPDLSVREMQHDLTARFEGRHEVTRESVYRLVREARYRNFLELRPPRRQALEAAITRAFPDLRDSVHVVVGAPEPRRGRSSAGGFDAVDDSLVPAQAARVACEFVVETFARRNAGVRGTSWKPVTIGLGPGWRTLQFCQEFARLLLTEAHRPRVRLVAITAGGPARAPHLTPGSFFNVFEDSIVTERIGFYGESLVPCAALPDVFQRVGAREAYALRDEIDLVVTSLGDMRDPDDLLRNFLLSSGVSAEEFEQGNGAAPVGNVQFRPYTAKGPAPEGPQSLRAITLFELDDLAAMARSGRKAVLLMASRCTACGRSRAAALAPLLENPSLRVFSHLVVDEPTARELEITRMRPVP